MILRVFATGIVITTALSAGSVAADEIAVADDLRLDFAEYFVSQPEPSAVVEHSPRPTVTRPTRSSASSSYARLARAPNMFGDSIGTIGQLAIRSNSTFETDLPLGGGRNLKVAENNKALPMDRVYFVYNGFQNAATSAQGPGPGALVASDGNLNRYTFGLEKTFLDGQWSIDVRMPITDNYAFNDPAFAFDSGNVGNLGLYLKHWCYSSDSLSIAGGLGFGLPTGSDLEGQILLTDFTVRNEAVHLVPFLGLLWLPTDSCFIQGFVDMDLAASGNDVELGPGNASIGTLTEQNLMHVDLSAARWLYQNDEALYVSGVAVVGELHHTSTLQDADGFSFATTGSPAAFGTFENLANRTDMLNVTGGLHFQIGPLSNLRVGCVIPVRNDPDRQFDSEIQVSFNRFF